MPAIARAGLSWTQLKPNGPSGSLPVGIKDPRGCLPGYILTASWIRSGRADTPLRRSDLGCRCPMQPLYSCIECWLQASEFQRKKKCWLLPCNSASMTNPMPLLRHIVGFQTLIPVTKTCCSGYLEDPSPSLTTRHSSSKNQLPLHLHYNLSRLPSAWSHNTPHSSSRFRHLLNCVIGLLRLIFPSCVSMFGQKQLFSFYSHVPGTLLFLSTRQTLKNYWV